MGSAARFYFFKWGLFDKLLQNQIPEQISRLGAFNLGPHVTNWGWTSDRLAKGTDKLDWIGTGPAATRALAGGAKKMILATSFYDHFTDLFAKSKNYRMLSIRIAEGPNAPSIRLLNFSNIEIRDILITDFSRLPPGFTSGQASFASIFLTVKDPTVDVFKGTEFSGPLDHIKEIREAARVLRKAQELEDSGR